LVVQSWIAPAGHFVATHFDVDVVRLVVSWQQTSPAAQLFEPEHVSVLPRQVPLGAMHVRVARQHICVAESQVVVPHTVWLGPPSVGGGGVVRPPPPPSRVGGVVPASLGGGGGVTRLPSGPTVGKPLSSTGWTDPLLLPPLLVLLPMPPLLVLPLLPLLPPLLVDAPPELLEPVEPPSPTVLSEPPHPKARAIETPRNIRKADMKDLLVRESRENSPNSPPSVGSPDIVGYRNSTHDGVTTWTGERTVRV
jgi:hypothetical protein